MKQLSLLLFLVLLSFPETAKAEYNGHYITFNMHLKDGNTVKGNAYLATIYHKDKDKTYKEYLESNYKLILNNQFADGIGDYTYHELRVPYYYKSHDGQKLTQYTLINKKEIEISTIASFTITEMINYGYLATITTLVTPEDIPWMQTEPEATFTAGGNLCYHEIFIHKRTPRTDAIVSQLKKEQEQMEKTLEEFQEILKSSDGEYYYEQRAKLEAYNESLDERFDEIVSKLQGEQVIVITECTC